MKRQIWPMRVVVVSLSIWLGLTLSGCRIVPNENPEDQALNLANPTIKIKSPLGLTPTEGIKETEASVTPAPTQPPISEAATLPKAATKATIITDKGEMTVLLYSEKAPKTVANFLAKAQSDFYQNLTFHRVEDWVIQGGDPKGDGTGGGTMPTELNDVAFKEGSLGVARGGNKAISNDAQFFICIKDCSWLTGDYTNFGEVTGGMEVAKQMAIGDKILKVTVQ